MRKIHLVVLALLGALVLVPPAYAGSIRCVKGTVQPPLNCLTFEGPTALADALNVGLGEVRIYGTVSAPDTVIIAPGTARVLRGMMVDGIRGTLDGTASPGLVLAATGAISGVKLTDLDVLTAGLPDSIGVFIDFAGQGTLNGLRVYGPPGGQGIGLDIRPTNNGLNIYGNTSASMFSGHTIGIRSTDTAHGSALSHIAIEDVSIGIQSISSRVAQWFYTTITCGRPGSIGFNQVAGDGEDHHPTISACSVAVQLECRTDLSPLAPLSARCGKGGEWGPVEITTDCVDAPCVAVRAIDDHGIVTDDYHADPTCAEAWATSVVIDGVPIQKFNSPGCGK